MNAINNIGPNDPVQRILTNPLTKNTPADPAAPTSLPVADTLELSGSSSYLQSLQTNNIRADLVSQVRGQIEAGTYETPDKLDGAINGLLDDLSK